MAAAAGVGALLPLPCPGVANWAWSRRHFAPARISASFRVDRDLGGPRGFLNHDPAMLPDSEGPASRPRKPAAMLRGRPMRWRADGWKHKDCSAKEKWAREIWAPKVVNATAAAIPPGVDSVAPRTCCWRTVGVDRAADGVHFAPSWLRSFTELRSKSYPRDHSASVHGSGGYCGSGPFARRCRPRFPL
jgi:hypothetical protein